MTVLAPPRHPHLDLALADARAWCAGHRIDQRPALAHAVQVAVVVGANIPSSARDPRPVVAALLHDGPEFAPAELDLDAHLTARYGPHLTRIVRAFEREHHAMDSDQPRPDVTDPDVLLLSIADKIVALASMLRRSQRAPDPLDFFRARKPFLRLLPYFHACHTAAAWRVPAPMTAALGAILERLDHATAPLRHP